ncbi:MAG: hypothetical protein DRQ65_04755 [Gammaproteobacteria bacterium]|nr:MAG: hypothetical protein DRQ65_04755 [Gammaproteobacteria bacterium]
MTADHYCRKGSLKTRQLHKDLKQLSEERSIEISTRYRIIISSWVQLANCNTKWHSIFGRNEPALIHFEREVAKAIGRA